MVILLHGEGNFSLLWYTLTKPPELQDISVNLLDVFYSEVFYPEKNGT